MSHQLENIDGNAQVMLDRVAWHRLGTVRPGGFSWADAEAEGLAATRRVQKVPMSELIFGITADGAALVAPEREYAAVREDGKVLATGLGEQWTPFQVQDAAEFGEVLREQAGANLVSIGTIYDGRKWFLTFDLGEFSIGDYKVSDYLSLNGSFDSTWTFRSITSPIIQVCANTVAMAKAMGTTHYSFKHTSRIYDRVEEAKRALRLHRASMAAFAAAANGLVTKSVTSKVYTDLLDALFPVDADSVAARTRNVNDAARESVTALFKGAGGLVADSGSAWDVVQAVNTYENWGRPIRGGNTPDNRALQQLNALVDGDQPLTSQAYGILQAV